MRVILSAVSILTTLLISNTALLASSYSDDQEYPTQVVTLWDKGEQALDTPEGWNWNNAIHYYELAVAEIAKLENPSLKACALRFTQARLEALSVGRVKSLVGQAENYSRPADEIEAAKASWYSYQVDPYCPDYVTNW